MATLLFIGHEATLTGAPFTQLHLINWIRKNTDHEVVLLLMWGGGLEAEFAKLAEVHVLEQGKPAVTIRERALAKLDRLTQYRRKQMVRSIARRKPDMLFANSAVSLALAVEMKAALHIPLVMNVHELENSFFFLSKEEFSKNTAQVDFFIPGSYAVKEYFATFCPIPAERVGVVYDFIESEVRGTSTAHDIRHAHGIPAEAKLVGAIGSLIWRKGADLFIQVARHVLRTDPDVYFVWVGGQPSDYHYKELVRDIRLIGLTDRILFVGGKSDLKGYYEAFDVLLLTSREDPFPLVCLEAAQIGTPLVCFANAGGMPEFVRDDAGFVVPYLDVEQMAEKTRLLLNTPDLARQRGQTGCRRVRAEHTIATIGPQMYEVIERFLR
ncbi:glycosyltransferase family 4 protein [Hymenobacter rubripertinctus]|uniref:Glycosyltransferase family 1 protein n=1 Tax=Hymenobacter rubripertinctus TaxID=2029981 RepID=A0A418QWL0_9BACT|nr:glycosyltransferase family 4 protein [Hymenobacter rubripertinctus]RIY09514.1 glycosyltransferase family 1 protein [Hymenobacter rubripertinctus]